jgi:hypothetical protein
MVSYLKELQDFENDKQAVDQQLGQIKWYMNHDKFPTL